MKFSLVQRAAPLLVTTMLVAVPAWAQTAGPDNSATTAPSGTSHKAMPQTSRSATARQPGETMQNLVERRIAELHSRLRITKEQSQPWDQFAQAMRDNAKEMDSLYRQRAEKFEAMSAVDNMQSYAQIEKQRAQDAEKLVPPFQALYASLNEQQKKDADQMFRTYAARAQERHHQAATAK